nr:E3 UFM1-protein ligase 1 homolog isoform X1 [Ipomoea batatas]
MSPWAPLPSQTISVSPASPKHQLPATSVAPKEATLTQSPIIISNSCHTILCTSLALNFPMPNRVKVALKNVLRMALLQGLDEMFFCRIGSEIPDRYLEGTSLATIFAHPSIIEMLDAAVEDTVDSVAAASFGTHDELHGSKGTTSSLADSNETGNDGGAAEAGSDNLDSAPSKSKKNQKKGKGSSTSQEVSSKLNAKKEEDHTRSQKID